MRNLKGKESLDRMDALDRDFRYTVFRAFLIVSTVLGLVFGFVNLMNSRPFVNVATGLAASLFCIVLYALSRDIRGYAFARIMMLAVFSVGWLPFGYLTSPGSMSAMPYLVIMVAFILSVVARKPAEYAFPGLMILQMPVLFRSELFLPGHYPKYASEAIRIDDLTVNFTVVLVAIVTTVIFLMREYDVTHRRLYELSVLDDLTGLYNRRYLLERIEAERERQSFGAKDCALAFIDLDNFKRVNDAKGHLAGDRVLEGIAEILRDASGDQAIAARFGGDEFVVFFPHTDRAAAEARMRELDVAFRAFCEAYADLGLAVSWGVSDSEGRTASEMLTLADDMLYRKKKRPE